MRKFLTGGAVLASAVAVMLPGGFANAAVGDTSLTLTIPAGSLAISDATATATLTLTGTVYATAVGPNVTIVDARAGVAKTFTLNAKLTNFVNTADPTHPVTADKVKYSSTAGVAAPAPYDLANGYLVAVIVGKAATAFAASNTDLAVGTGTSAGKTGTVVPWVLTTDASNYTAVGDYTATLTHTAV
ncbi:MAG: hypothetical protein LLG14_25395 [Nocardiaceae bacterium]|nr:hypothetical protein [Nocardiaceae bacterium]